MLQSRIFNIANLSFNVIRVNGTRVSFDTHIFLSVTQNRLILLDIFSQHCITSQAPSIEIILVFEFFVSYVKFVNIIKY